MSTIWGGVFGKNEDNSGIDIQDINESISFDQKLYKQDIRASIVHAKMLYKIGILSSDEVLEIEKGMAEIADEIESGTFEFRKDLEDIHMNIENALFNKIGDAAKKLHTARSRNDQVATDFKLYTIEGLQNIKVLLQDLLLNIVQRAENALESRIILPGFTHLQIAQPISLAHYLMAFFEMFKRDLQKCNFMISDASTTCPLGSCALSGTTYSTDRAYVASQLGFAAPCENSIDGVSDRDFALDYMYLCSVTAMHMSRMAEDIIIYSSQPFGFFKLPDSFSTGSSIMPQKRNPDVAELVRGKTGRIYSNLSTLLVAMKGVGLAYYKDLQEDKEALFDAQNSTEVCLKSLTKLIRLIGFDKDKMLATAKMGYSNATELADYLVGKGVPFRVCHHISGSLVKIAIEKSCTLDDLDLEEIARVAEEFGYKDVIEKDVFEWLNVVNAVQRRSSYGGTGFDAVAQEISNAREFLSSLL